MTTEQLDLMTVQEVAALLRLHVTHIRRLARLRQLPAVQIGKAWRFNRADLMAWLKSKSHAA